MNAQAQPAPDVRLSEIGQIFVRVKDLDRAVRFYRDTLGVPFLFQAPPGMAFFQCSGQTLLLGVADKPEYDHPSSTLYFKVAEIEKTASALEAKGVKFIARPHPEHKEANRELWLGFFKDSEENIHALMSWQTTA
jgi:methylmalonyl-CoA/ethylmalonyl-CoA epimerase